MVRGYHHSNAILIYNLGCEMIYVLHHRLKNLDVAADKIQKAIIDISKTLFSDKVISKLFEPKPILGLEYIKSLLFQICHCSIITLDISSFTKLYEMILIGIKRQMLAMVNMQGIYHMTINHLTTVGKLVKDKNLFTNIDEEFQKLFNQMSNYDYYMIRCFILNSLNPKNVKVSFYLSDKSQSSDGNITVTPPDCSGYCVDKVGTRFDGEQKVSNTKQNNHNCYKFVKAAPSSTYKSEKSDVGTNVFEKLGTQKNDVDYVIVDKEYIAKESKELINQIKGSSASTDEKITIDFGSIKGSSMMGSSFMEDKKASNLGPSNLGAENYKLQKANTIKTQQIIDSIDDMFDSNAPKQSPKKEQKNEIPEDEEMDGDDLLELMDGL